MRRPILLLVAATFALTPGCALLGVENPLAKSISEADAQSARESCIASYLDGEARTGIKVDLTYCESICVDSLKTQRCIEHAERWISLAENP